jgi:hypothetical protein
VSFAERLRRAVAGQERRPLVDVVQHRIDTRDDAFGFAASPWNWGWMCFNGHSVNPFALPGDGLEGEIARSIPAPRPRA